MYYKITIDSQELYGGQIIKECKFYSDAIAEYADCIDRATNQLISTIHYAVTIRLTLTNPQGHIIRSLDFKFNRS